MTTHKNILIGSDTSSSLAAIIKSLQEVNQYSFITATRVSDIVQISKSLQPLLIVLSFRNNQHVINSLQSYFPEFTIPLVCLQKRNEYYNLQVKEQTIAFIYSFEDSVERSNLSNNIKGIIKLLNLTQTQKHQKTTTLAHTSNTNLTRYTLELDQKKQMLHKIKERIKELYSNVDATTKTKLMSIVNTIKMTRNNQKHWDDFKLYFENINPNFLKRLTTQFPCLTAKDLKYCCYLKMNMSNEDIRFILGINQESVRTHKYRLKKKMVLNKEQDLRMYIQSYAS
ncbi:helix-turn-helix transcriptional regulator [Kordia sp.]|uniref:helix-turn-helix transcriptional regulator n=1 Tax=Kordia sp. TaxID=1965332 RepID=UPI003D28A70C